jgi:hypothetical protein
VELALAVGVLLLPVALVVIGFGPWSERRVEAEAVAAEAARSTVIELSHEAGLATAAAITAAYGIPPQQARIGWCGAEPTVAGAGFCTLQRGAVVSVTVELWTPLVATPWGPVGGLWVVGEHSEPIDLYRSLG